MVAFDKKTKNAFFLRLFGNKKTRISDRLKSEKLNLSFMRTQNNVMWSENAEGATRKWFSEVIIEEFVLPVERRTGAVKRSTFKPFL